MVEYGIAATFLVAIALVEMLAFGLQQQIVQAKDGDDPRLQAGLQGFQVLRGVLSALALFLMAAPLAAFLRMPEITWAYQLLAVVPVLNALQHFDIHRFNRQMRFGPLVFTSAVPAFISLLAIWPLSAWFLDYRLMLSAILIQVTLTAVASHLVAERRYWLLLEKATLRRGFDFGWPLLVNSVLLFLVYQGDKLIVGRELGPEVLAIFAMGLTLTLSPSLIFERTILNFFLPQLSALQGKPEAQAILSAVVMQAVLVFSVVFVLGVLLVGQPIVHAILGAKYAELLPLLTLFAVLQGVRVLKQGPGIVALSIGETKNPMFANLVRVLTIPIVWIVVIATSDVRIVLWIVIAGECAAHFVALWQLQRAARFPLISQIRPHLAAGAMIAGMTVLSLFEWWDYPSVILAFALSIALGLVLLGRTMPQLRTFIRQSLRPTESVAVQ